MLLENNMKVLLVNTYDSGGAANACIRMHLGLLKEGVDSKLLLLKKNNFSIPKSEEFRSSFKRKTLLQKIKHKLIFVFRELKVIKKNPSKKELFIKNRIPGLELFSFPDSNFDITESSSYKEADIINLHWVADFLDYKSFFKKNKKPVVWTLHDMNPFSGGEHFTEKYLGKDKDGFPINRKTSEEEELIFSQILTYKANALKNVSNLHIVALCTWMKKEVEKSTVFKNYPTYLIPNGIDSEVFKPRGKKISRELLNLPLDKKIVLFVADHIDNNRKGFAFLENAVSDLVSDEILLCAIGNSTKSTKSNNNIVELGKIYDERLMSVAYSAADVFVIPSLMDNLPNTVLESLLCGTPVIGFPVGGIKDLIIPGENGLLTENISVKSLIKTINTFMANIKMFNKDLIRENAIKTYDISIQSKAYAELFKKIIEK